MHALHSPLDGTAKLRVEFHRQENILNSSLAGINSDARSPSGMARNIHLREITLNFVLLFPTVFAKFTITFSHTVDFNPWVLIANDSALR